MDGRAAIDASMTERELMEQVRQLADIHGWLTYHTFDSRRSTKGFPDLVLTRPPRVIFVELKTQNGRLLEAQKYWLGELAQCPGVESYIWRPSDWERVLEVLR